MGKKWHNNYTGLFINIFLLSHFVNNLYLFAFRCRDSLEKYVFFPFLDVDKRRLIFNWKYSFEFMLFVIQFTSLCTNAFLWIRTLPTHQPSRLNDALSLRLFSADSICSANTIFNERLIRNSKPVVWMAVWLPSEDLHQQIRKKLNIITARPTVVANCLNRVLCVEFRRCYLNQAHRI